MMRQIDADLLKEQMESVCMGIMAGTDSYNAPLKTIDDAPTVDTEPRWIPIEERPPQFGKDVLVSYRGGVMADWLTQCEGNAYFYIPGVAIQDVDAWMPLPEPWKGDANDK